MVPADLADAARQYHRSMSTLTIRPATRGDVALILQLVRELADYEKAPDQAVATPADMERALFGEISGRAPLAECVIGEVDGKPEGLALFFMNFSTWTGRPGMYLEDLFVRPSARGKGLGKALFEHVARLAAGRGCSRYEWAVLDWNTPAIEFYKAHGAKAMDEWTVYRMNQQQIAALAATGPLTP
ncbi:MAG: N-acetyltransferase [Phycisphaerae bacterium]